MLDACHMLIEKHSYNSMNSFIAKVKVMFFSLSVICSVKKNAAQAVMHLLRFRISVRVFMLF